MKQNLLIDNHSLIEECKKGDKEALNLLYIRFAPRMLSVIRRYVQDPKDAEDILHDGFIVAFTRLDSLRDYNRADYWLATIMKNLSLQFLSSQDVAGILHEIPEIEDTPKIEEIIDLETLETLIKKLPEGYQKVFRLAVLENKSHKEIGRLLGIAPNSSSSQLFHAKLLMRKLINDYKVQTGLLSLLIIGFTALMFLWKDNSQPEMDATQIRMAQEASAPLQEENLALVDIPENENAENIQKQAPAVVIAHYDTVTPPAIKKVAEADTIVPIEEIRQEETHQEINVAEKSTTETEDSLTFDISEPLYAYADIETLQTPSNKKWTFNVDLRGSAVLYMNSVDYDDEMNALDPPIGTDPNHPTNPDDNNNSSSDKNNVVKSRARTKDNFSKYKDANHTFFPPISLAAMINRNIGDRISLASGVVYTYLYTSAEYNNTKAGCHWHYLGIPLKLNVKTFSTRKFRGDASIGAQFDIPVYTYTARTSGDSSDHLPFGRFSSNPVFSLTASYLIALKLNDKFDIYMEPTLRYNFKNDYQVPNIWSDEPFSISLPIGIRFNYK